MKEKKREHLENRKDKDKAENLEVESDNVFFVGLNEIDYADQKLIKNILYDEYIKIERALGVAGMLKFHFKKYEHGGREKYSVHLMLEFPGGKPIVCTQVYDPVRWDAVAEVHLLLKKAKAQVEHRAKNIINFNKSRS